MPATGLRRVHDHGLGDVLTWADARVNGLAGIPPYARMRYATILNETVPRQRAWVHRHLTAACS